MGRKLAKPIITLAKKVETGNIETFLSLSKIKSDYSEIDSLAGAIERFNRKVLDASLKTENIIRMVNLPLCTFEYNKDSDVVTCSDAFLKLIDLSVEEGTIVGSKLFFQRIEEIKENVESDLNDIYMINDTTNRWVKLVSIEHDNSVLGICMDQCTKALK